MRLLNSRAASPWLLAALLAVAGAAPSKSPSASAKVIAAEPFYQAPDNIDDLEPGTVIRHRKPPSPISALGSSPIDLKESYQLLYKTTDSFNKSVATVLTVLVPHKPDFSKVLSYQVAQDSSYVRCAPSFVLQKKTGKAAKLGSSLTELELAVVGSCLKKGWVAIMPDHEGPHAAFLANTLAGHAVLDGIRAAARSHSITGIAKKPRVVLWGYSGGSIASGRAAELQPTYAPELNIAGAALGGVVPRMESTLHAADRSLFAGLIPGGILGLSHQYPKIKKVVEKHLKPAFRSAFAQVERQCLLNSINQFAFKGVKDMFDDPSIFSSEPVTSILRENKMGQSAPAFPLYVYKGVLDQVSPVREADELVDFYCENGASVEYVRMLAAEHLIGMVSGFPSAVAWLSDRMEGKTAKRGCTKTNRAFLFTAPAVTRTIPLSDLLGFFGKFKISNKKKGGGSDVFKSLLHRKRGSE